VVDQELGEGLFISLHNMINLNGTNWNITSLGVNNNFYYVSVSDEVNTIDYVIDVSVIDKTKLILPQIYNYILTQPDFAGGTLISS
jgi:hypothetical protein